jgi:dihydrofolate reductase
MVIRQDTKRTSNWKGWWGENPPYHAPTFILTHYPRDPIVMEGGTTFHFVTNGFHAALERASDAAGDLDIKIGGGVSTVRDYLRAGLIDELHLTGFGRDGWRAVRPLSNWRWQ